MLDIAALGLVAAALLACLNRRFTRLPMAIGVMVTALLGLSCCWTPWAMRCADAKGRFCVRSIFLTC